MNQIGHTGNKQSVNLLALSKTSDGRAARIGGFPSVGLDGTQGHDLGIHLHEASRPRLVATALGYNYECDDLATVGSHKTADARELVAFERHDAEFNGNRPILRGTRAGGATEERGSLLLLGELGYRPLVDDRRTPHIDEAEEAILGAHADEAHIGHLDSRDGALHHFVQAQRLETLF